MKYSSWLFNRSSPDDRSNVAEGLTRLIEFIEENYTSLPHNITVDCTDAYLHLMRVRAVLRRERELQLRVSDMGTKEVNPELVVHMDCNKLRVMSDKKLCALLLRYIREADASRELSKSFWLGGCWSSAHRFRLRRRAYEQAVIKLTREIERRVRVYNLR